MLAADRLKCFRTDRVTHFCVDGGDCAGEGVALILRHRINHAALRDNRATCDISSSSTARSRCIGTASCAASRIATCSFSGQASNAVR